MKLQRTKRRRQSRRKKGLEVEAAKSSRGHIIALFFDEFVEDKLITADVYYRYPVEISPLAKRKPSDPSLTERFEVFITGREFGNAFSELNDPIDQRVRFEHQAALRAAGDDEANMVDEGLPYGA